MKKLLPVNCPQRKADTTLSRSPHRNPATRTPAMIRAISRVRETAPQISTSASSPETSLARLKGSRLVRILFSRFTSLPSSISIRQSLSETSKTGDMRSCQYAIAIFILSKRCKVHASSLSVGITINNYVLEIYQKLPLDNIIV